MKIFNKLATLSVCIFTLSTSLLAQDIDIPFDKKHFKDNPDGLKEALHDLKLGDRDFAYDGFSRRKALKHFLDAYDFNPNSAELNYKIGVCYFYTPTHENSIQYLEKAHHLNPTVYEDLYYQMGYAYHLNEEWEKAISWYQKYKTFITHQVNTHSAKRMAWQLNDTDKRIKECKSGIHYSKRPEKISIHNLGDSINTPYPEYNLVIPADESFIMFTAMRPASAGHEDMHHLEIHYNWEDIYISHKKDDSTWSKAIPVVGINTEKNDAVVGLTPDGQQIILYRDEDSEDGNLFTCKREGNQWGKIKPFSAHINSKFQESSASFSADGKKIYFVSNNPHNNMGGHDIYVSEWDEKHHDWSKPKNLGPTINTEYDEQSVYIHPNGKTLYFSSQGHSSMGGLDIFKTTLKDEHWSTPENLGYPINGPSNDLVMHISADGKRGYYSSFRHETRGEEDLFLVEFDKSDEETEKLTLVKGFIVDPLSNDSIEATIEIVDVETHEVIASFTSNSASGEFLIPLPSGKNYALIVEKEGYMHYSENFNVGANETFKQVDHPIYLQKAFSGNSIVLNNVFFEFRSSSLQESSRTELDKLVTFLKLYPELKIEIGGHTDNKGTKQYNKKLSTIRAKAVVDYLIAHGIAERRLKYKGYGFDKPVASNDTEEGRAKNRRTELQIIKNTQETQDSK